MPQEAFSLASHRHTGDSVYIKRTAHIFRRLLTTKPCVVPTFSAIFVIGFTIVSGTIFRHLSSLRYVAANIH